MGVGVLLMLSFSQQSSSKVRYQFEDGVRISAKAADPNVRVGSAPLSGKKYQYPTAVLFDIDNDKQDELVLSNIKGDIFYCEKKGGRPGTAWGKAKAIKAVDGKQLSFSNW